MKLMGAALVVLGSIRIGVSCVRKRREMLSRVQKLAAALLDMEASVRWKRQVLPKVIAAQTRRTLCGTYFADVLERFQAGETLQNAWEAAFSFLQPPAAAEYLRQVELSGDEQHLIGNLHLAAENLQRLYQEMQGKQKQEEKLYLSLLFSATGMAIILLL